MLVVLAILSGSVMPAITYLLERSPDIDLACIQEATPRFPVYGDRIQLDASLRLTTFPAWVSFETLADHYTNQLPYRVVLSFSGPSAGFSWAGIYEPDACFAVEPAPDHVICHYTIGVGPGAVTSGTYTWTAAVAPVQCSGTGPVSEPARFELGK